MYKGYIIGRSDNTGLWYAMTGTITKGMYNIKSLKELKRLLDLGYMY